MVFHTTRKRISILATIMILVAVGVGSSAIGLLYQTALDEQRARLTEIVQSRARMIEAIAKFDARHSTDYPAGAKRATLSQIRDAHKNFAGFGKTGEFVLAERMEDEIVFLLRHRNSLQESPKRMSIRSKFAEPMRRALAGRSGILVGLDYRGEKVLAAYEPIKILKMGVVAKIDIAEVRAPFRRMGLIVLYIASVIVWSGLWVFFRLSGRIISDLADSERRYRELIEQQADLVCRSMPDGTLTFANEAYCVFFGKSFNELIGKNFAAFIPQDRQGQVFGEISALSPENRSATHEHDVISGTGENRYVQWTNTLMLNEEGKPAEIISVGHDVTERKSAEIAFVRANRALEVLLACNAILVRAKTEPELLTDICREIVQNGHYRLAWVGMAENNKAKSVRPVAHFGDESGYLASIKVSWGTGAHGQGPSGTAIRTGESVIARNIPKDPKFKPWREAAMKRGYNSAISIPLLDDGKAFGCLNIYAAEIDAFGDIEVILLTNLANDLTYGLSALQETDKRKKAETAIDDRDAKLQVALLSTVKALANTIEQRDPYTAGHQDRVAQLAVAIGSELGLAKSRLTGIEMGGVIHDIGKIAVPAEVLNRPGALSEAEFALIKAHPEKGYAIVKEIDFAWPVTEMILQHHERLDGSGYPNGLKGDKICLEARIIAVADVVEAITSHRPYRPGRGIDVALDEITEGRKTLYDPDVVEACVTLFKTKHFKWSNGRISA